MEEIFIDKPVSFQDIEASLKLLFPGLEFFQWFPREGNIDPTGFNLDDPAHALFDIYEESHRLNFWWRLTTYGPSEGHEERARFIAKYLSKKLATRTLVSYQLPDEPYNPYYNLIYANGIGYLADDCMFDWTGESDEPAEPIKIVRLFELPDAAFDALANLLK